MAINRLVGKDEALITRREIDEMLRSITSSFAALQTDVRTMRSSVAFFITHSHRNSFRYLSQLSRTVETFKNSMFGYLIKAAENVELCKTVMEYTNEFVVHSRQRISENTTEVPNPFTIKISKINDAFDGIFVTTFLLKENGKVMHIKTMHLLAGESLFTTPGSPYEDDEVGFYFNENERRIIFNPDMDVFRQKFSNLYESSSETTKAEINQNITQLGLILVELGNILTIRYRLLITCLATYLVTQNAITNDEMGMYYFLLRNQVAAAVQEFYQKFDTFERNVLENEFRMAYKMSLFWRMTTGRFLQRQRDEPDFVRNVRPRYDNEMEIRITSGTPDTTRYRKVDLHDYFPKMYKKNSYALVSQNMYGQILIQKIPHDYVNPTFVKKFSKMALKCT